MNKRDALNILTSAKEGFVSTTAETIAIPFLRDCRLPVTFFAQEIDLDHAADALLNFGKATPSTRQIIQDQLFKAAQQSFQDCACDFASPQKQLDWESESTGRFTGAKVPTRPADIWSLVTFTSVHIAPAITGGPQHYVLKVTGTCAWDGEHGVAVNFAQDGRFIGVRAG